jgi:hypothetical protein
MIKKVGEQIQMEFGVGDIHIESGWFIPENGVNKLGLVTFENHDKPMPIGRNNNNLSKEVELWKYPIYMTFSRPESIDALIAELENAKAEMLKIE